ALRRRRGGHPQGDDRARPGLALDRARAARRLGGRARRGGARFPRRGASPDCSSEGGYAPLGLPRRRSSRAVGALLPASPQQHFDCGGKAAARTALRVYCTAAMRDRADRWDYLFAGALGILTVLSRLPYRARMLYNWDGVQFALALREYDVVKHQPHPPGYILYVGLGRVVNAWLHDPTAAYVLLAVA